MVFPNCSCESLVPTFEVVVGSDVNIAHIPQTFEARSHPLVLEVREQWTKPRVGGSMERVEGWIDERKTNERQSHEVTDLLLDDVVSTVQDNKPQVLYLTPYRLNKRYSFVQFIFRAQRIFKKCYCDSGSDVIAN